MHARTIFALLWIGWMISWIVAASWSRPIASEASGRDQLGYRVVQTIAALMLGFSAAKGVDRAYQLWTVSDPVAWELTGVVAAGIAFAWWARLHLGALWSSDVTRKEGHRVVDTGPYRIVRHPIYTGLLLSLGATAAWVGRPLAISGAALFLVAFWIKARLEERFLRADLTDYDAYARRVPMLIPFVK